MNTIVRIPLLVAATASALLGGAGHGAHADSDPARARAGVQVTIQVQGTDLSGTVISSRLACIADRTVVVFKQIGPRGGGDDIRFASDTTSVLGSGTASWSTGNTGTPGKFYAVVRRTATCQRAASPTVTASR